MYYTYVLKSQKDKKLYIGWTDDLKKRLLKHNQSKVISTKIREPFEIVYYEACNNRTKAIERKIF